VNAVEPESVEHRDDIAAEVAHGDWRVGGPDRRRRGPPVAPRVDAHHAEPLGEGAEDGVPHLPRRTERIEEHQRRRAVRAVERDGELHGHRWDLLR
jgi:hypothetical protein